MSENYFPFMSVSGDRKYNADNWAAYFGLFLRDGIFYSDAAKLKVVPNDGMTVKINKGAAFISGRCYILDADLRITMDIADGALNRIDRIVLRCDYTERKITAKVKKGSYSASPIATELQRNADAYEIALADVYVAKGVVSITAANITDHRLNNSFCGIVTGLVEQADTTAIFNEFFTYLQEFKTLTQVDIENWTTEQQRAFTTWYMQQQEAFTTWYNRNTTAWKQEFTTWFNDIQGIMSGDVAANITNRVIQLETKAAALEVNKAQKILLDEDQQAAGVNESQGFSLCIKNGALCVRRAV